MRAPSLLRAICASALVLSALPSEAFAQNEPVPLLELERDDRVYPPPGTQYKLAVAGLLTTGVFYGAAAGMSYAYPDAPGAKDLRIPVAGPWMAIANNGCPPNDPDCSRVWVVMRTILTAVDGLGQAAGVGMMIESLFLPTQEPGTAPVKPRRAPEIEEEEPPPPEPTGPLFQIPVPTVIGQDGVGVGWGGVF